MEYLERTKNRGSKVLGNQLIDFQKEKIMSAISLSNVASQPSPAAPPATAASTFWQKYLSERRPDVQQLKDALQSGDIAAAQQDYKNLVALGNSVLGKDNPFVRSDRALDFDAVGGALQNGDLTGAQQAFATLENSFHQILPPETNLALSTTTAGSAPDTNSASGVNITA
jgi:hypothetical protein